MAAERARAAHCLSLHAGYRCGHSGACCSAGWGIPFDAAEYERLRGVDLVPDREIEIMFVMPGRRGDMAAALAAKRADGACIFLQDDPHLCAIHRLEGHDALPVTCRMFPRVVLMDPRGTLVSLSHFCPTAAALLFEPIDLEIVEAPDSLVNVGPLEALDARDTWPPLLRPGVLMDLESYARWERFGVEVFARPDLDPWQALDLIGRVTDRISRWKPGGLPLADAMMEAIGDPELTAVSLADPTPRMPRFGGRDAIVRDAVPAHLGAPDPPDDFDERLPRAIAGVGAHRAAVCRWLAARLFGTWVAYQGEGLRTIAGYLRGCLDVLIVEAARAALHEVPGRQPMIEAFRRSDMLTIHLAISASVARRFSEIEER